nr:phage portal protein [Rhizobium sp. Q54]
MRLFGLEITRNREKALSPVGERGWHRILESFSGAWQRNVEVNYDSVLSNHADFACRTLIASDIAKLRVKLVQKDSDGIWNEVNNPAYSPVLRKPNRYQNRIQFFESWVLSKLQRGNTYVMKQRDGRGVVTGLYVLDPTLVTVLVADSGDVFYELRTDHLAGLTERVVVPAREIIHDRFNCMFHPLVGISPIFASGLAAMQGLSIQNDSTLFFQNGAQPGGVLTAPGAISDDTAKRLKEYWDSNFSGKNAGKVAVLGDGLDYKAMKAKAVDSQLIEQLKWSAEVVCGVYHVPTFMIGVGQEPNYNNVQNLTIRYYSQCLQKLIEDLEACLDEGLGMDGITIGVEFDVDDLLRMDAQTQMDVLEKSKGKMTVNEQRKRLNLKPVTGGDTVYLQEQDHSLEWLSRRDAQPIEAPAAPEPQSTEDDEARQQAEERAFLAEAALAFQKGLAA